MELCVGQLTLHFTDDGPRDAETVVLLHAFPVSGAMWAPQVEALRARWRVVVPDIRGLGRSEAGDGQHTLEHLVDDLLALLDALAVERAVLCGLSMGGYIALRTAERAPERVRALVLADTRPEADANPARLARAAALRRLKEEGVAAFAEGFTTSALSPATRATRPATVAQVRAMIEANAPLGIGGALLALVSRTDTAESLGKIGVPALILVGAEDTLTPPALSEAMAARIPNARLAVIPGAGHLSSLENPDAFNTALIAFLSSLS